MGRGRGRCWLWRNDCEIGLSSDVWDIVYIHSRHALARVRAAYVTKLTLR